ncbi:hypothetical protein [Flavobacterium turcicum]|uniref:Uncharacterized protein n=1 Tax=Flavobacterium turcicum TaxID=2764718 RepID=A0ABR7JKH5_9FLAO|nr:hypothetical protein [Flavobacterium turcicum]MBC5864684.1 hypothetical protein [Flavobacterium turcicum]NHL03416.1 hypothetical protein [Flavobacterium turcicum]
MTKFRLSKKKIIILSIVGVVLTSIYLTYLNLENSIMEYYSKNWVSKSITESKSKGAFVRELKFSPNEIEKYGLKIQFNECWIEQQTKLEHSFLFFEEYKPTGKYRMCFNLKEKLPEINTLLSYFFINQNGKSFEKNGSGNLEVFSASIDKNRKEQIKINFVKSFKEPEEKIVTVNFK